jgi:hypothetical protein
MNINTEFQEVEITSSSAKKNYSLFGISQNWRTRLVIS